MKNSLAALSIMLAGALAVAWTAASPRVLHGADLLMVGGYGPCAKTVTVRCTATSDPDACWSVYPSCSGANTTGGCVDGGEGCQVAGQMGCDSRIQEECI